VVTHVEVGVSVRRAGSDTRDAQSSNQGCGRGRITHFGVVLDSCSMEKQKCAVVEQMPLIVSARGVSSDKGA
jgi:hypothetical protein